MEDEIIKKLNGAFRFGIVNGFVIGFVVGMLFVTFLSNILSI